MSEKKVSIKNAFIFSLRFVWKIWPIFLMVVSLAAIFNIMIYEIIASATYVGLLYQFIIYISVAIINSIALLVCLRISLDVVRSKKTSLKEIYSLKKNMWNLIMASLAVSALLAAGPIVGNLLKFIIPFATVIFDLIGIVWGIHYAFYIFAVADGDKAIEAIKNSRKIGKGAFWTVFLSLLIVSIVSMIFGKLFMGMFMVVIFPMLLIFISYIYDSLRGQTKIEQETKGRGFWSFIINPI